MVSETHRPLEDLVEWADNYNNNDINAIALSIRRFGFNQALRVWQDNQVMAGNHTCKALKQIQADGPRPEQDRDWPPENILVEDGNWYVQIVDVSHLDALEAKAFAIADNELARQAVRDDVLLAQYLQEINLEAPELRTATGFADDAYHDLVSRVLEEVSEPAEDAGAQMDHGEELRVQWQVEPGQLWIIPSKTANGDHRLLCGDSTSPDDVQRLMNGERAVLFATDPPYLVGYDGTNHPHQWNETDNNKDWSATYHDWDNPEHGEELYDGFVRVAVAEAITEDAAWYCWHASRCQALLEQVWQQHGAFVHQQIIWAKDRPVLTRSWYMWQHEPCFFGWKQGHKPRRIAEDHPATVWQIPTIAPGTSTDHPTSKPVEVFTRPMLQHTYRGELCYEPFAGSGSQLVAGEQTGRRVYGMEREPVYVAVILQRLADMGLEPHLAA